MAGRLSGVASRIMGGNGVVARSVGSSLRQRAGMGLPVGKHIVPNKPLSVNDELMWDNGTAFPEPCIDRIADTVGKFAPPMDSVGELSDGRLTVEGFYVAARAFVDRWKTHNQSLPPWSWVPLINRSLLVSNKEEGYLSLEKIIILTSLEENPKEESLNVATDYLEKEESFDNTILVQTLENEAHYYDFHIVYSVSYKVPVLYFRGYCSGGEPLSLDVIKKDLPSCSVSLLLESKWTFITQEEHPYLNRPWFKLHPCGTEDWIKLLSQSSSSAGCQMPVELYLVSWFSVVGQVVGLRIPLEMLN